MVWAIKAIYEILREKNYHELANRYENWWNLMRASAKKIFWDTRNGSACIPTVVNFTNAKIPW